MIDPKVLTELQEMEIITQVDVKPEYFNSLEDLKNAGLVTIGDTEKIYDAVVEEVLNMSEALNEFRAAIAAGGKVTLPMSFVLDSPLVVEKDVEIDLNGHTLSTLTWDEDGEANSYIFWVKSGKLTINGNGVVSATDAVYSMAVWANGGDVEINGGKFENGGDSCDLIYASKKGNVVINGGEFVAAGPASGTVPGTKNPYSALNVKDANRTTCLISVKGGKFFKFNPADNLSEGPGTSFVAEGYEAVQYGDWYTVDAVPAIVVDDNAE